MPGPLHLLIVPRSPFPSPETLTCIFGTTSSIHLLKVSTKSEYRLFKSIEIFVLTSLCETLCYSSQLTVFIWTASSEFGTYRLCEQRRFRRACASAQSRQNLRCSLIQAVSQEEPSDRKPDPWPLWMAGHAQLKFVMTECSKTQIRLTGLI